ncbi:response regulator transcription factor [Novosphingobium aquiterrae]|uniref:Response regulator transcription factor n=1 Tax=Novosphingobium aquiterrae TaxID=624388 RepID=A0ABV6PGI2_9SPHN
MDTSTIVHVIDEDAHRRADLAKLVYSLGWHAEISASLEEFVSYTPLTGFVLLHDRPDQHSVTHLFRYGHDHEIWFPVIVYDCAPRPGQIVDAILAGGSDYLSYPISAEDLAVSLSRLREISSQRREAFLRKAAAQERIGRLTRREGQILSHMVSGKTNRLIAKELGISSKTVEIHRTHLIAKLGAQNTIEAVRIGLEALRPTASIGD